MSHLCFQVCSCLTSMLLAAVLTVIGHALIPLHGCSQGLVPGVPCSPRICRDRRSLVSEQSSTSAAAADRPAGRCNSKGCQFVHQGLVLQALADYLRRTPVAMISASCIRASNTQLYRIASTPQVPYGPGIRPGHRHSYGRGAGDSHSAAGLHHCRPDTSGTGARRGGVDYKHRLGQRRQ